jgi:hypothetical protein
LRTAAALVAFALLAALAAAEEPEFDLLKGPLPRVTAGKPATLSLSIAPRPSFRLLADGPIELHTSGEGLTLPRPWLSREGAVDPHADVPRFELPIVGGHAGPAHVRVDVTFYVCRAARCRPVKADATWDLEVVP